LEALAAGIPTACSNIEPLAGIADKAAVQFDPSMVEDMTAALARIADDYDLRGRLAHAGPVRAAAFSWDETAKGVLGVIVNARVSGRAPAAST
jgi:alpha-1,3-rhamnosyl/mannosyltransferase